MPTVEIPVRLTWSGATGSPGASIWHFRTNDESAPVNVQDGVNAVMNFFNEVRSIFPTSWTAYFDGNVYGVGDDSEKVFSASYDPVTGTGGNDFLPPATAICVTMKGGLRTRRGIGRKFLSPLQSGVAQSNGTPTEAARATIRDAMDNLLGFNESFNNGGIGIYSKAGDVFYDMTSFVVPNEFATLRSRRD